MALMSTGQLTERVTIQALQGAIAVTSLTRSGALVTVTTTAAHLAESGDRWTIAGAGQAAYNATHVITVTGASAFTFPIAGSPDTPATGTITATYAGNRQGGKSLRYATLASSVAANVRPWETQQDETLQANRVTPQQHYRVTLRYRADVQPSNRILWTPHRATTPTVLEIAGGGPVGGERTWLRLDCQVVG